MADAKKTPVPALPEDIINLEILKRKQAAIVARCYSICFVNFVLSFATIFVLEQTKGISLLHICIEVLAWLSPLTACAFLCGAHNLACSVLFPLIIGCMCAGNLGLVALCGYQNWEDNRGKWSFLLYLVVGVARVFTALYLLTQLQTFRKSKRGVRDLEFRVSLMKKSSRKFLPADKEIIIPKPVEDIEEVLIEYSDSDTSQEQKTPQDHEHDDKQFS